MPQIHDVPDDWNPARRCCLECGNSTPDVRLRAITHPTTNQQALACTRHTSEVAAVLDSFASAPEAPAEPSPSPPPPRQQLPGTSRKAPDVPPRGDVLHAHEPAPLALDRDTHRQIALLARAWSTTPQGVFHRLLAHFEHPATEDLDVRQALAALAAPPPLIPVYARYAYTRIDAVFEPTTSSVTVPHGPGEGTYKSPSGASAAVIRALRPDVAPNRTSWSFWRITASGQPLSTLRTPARISTYPAAAGTAVPAVPRSAAGPAR